MQHGMQHHGYPGEQAPLFNPPVPFYEQVPGGSVTPGQMIFIKGTPHGDFSINLHNGGFEGADFTFHFNVRFGEDSVIRNSQLDQEWGPEEKEGGLPFQFGVPFDLIILVQENSYMCAVNGVHFCEYGHRAPLHDGNTLGVRGDVQIHSAHFQGGHANGGHVNEFHPFHPPPPALYNPPVPLDYHLPGGLTYGRMLIVRGMLTMSAEKFTINLQEGPQMHNVALHFDVRPNDNVVVRNSMVDGDWGPEERDQPFFPFQMNGDFTVYILCDAQGYKVAINDSHFIEYGHRIQPINRIDTVNINGAAQLYEVSMQ